MGREGERVGEEREGGRKEGRGRSEQLAGIRFSPRHGIKLRLSGLAGSFTG